MLVLSRNLGQSIRIGDDIRVTIVRVKGGRISVGIEAPDSVRILRDELPVIADQDVIDDVIDSEETPASKRMRAVV